MNKSKLIFISVFIILLITSCTQNESSYSTDNEQQQEEQDQIEQQEAEYKAIRIIRDDEDTGDAQSQNEDNDTEDSPENPVVGLKELATAVGDLNKDKIAEKVVVYATNRNSKQDLGTEREIHVYKKRGEKWRLWHKSIGAVLPSKHGGMMGDPFQSLTIERGAIVFKHFGGSRFKWAYTHRFRYQNNNWELIGATIEDLAACEYVAKLDWNFSTGKYIYTKEAEECNGENPQKTSNTRKEARKKLSRLPIMNGYYPGNNELVISNETTVYY